MTRITGVTENINGGSALFKCPSKSLTESHHEQYQDTETEAISIIYKKINTDKDSIEAIISKNYNAVNEMFMCVYLLTDGDRTGNSRLRSGGEKGSMTGSRS